MIWYVFLLIMAGFVAFSIWSVRKKVAEREAASRARFEQMFQNRQAAEPVVASPPPASGAGTIPAAAAVPALPARQRFLDPAQTLVYYLLRTGLRDHEIFANVTLASVVGVGDGDPQARRLSQHRLDFVVCDKGTRIVAVIELEGAAGAEVASVQRFRSECLGAAGIRIVRLNAKALPARGEIRTLVCGERGADQPAVPAGR